MIKCKEAFEIAVIEHLGPEALAHGTMSIYQAAEIMWQAAWNGATQNAKRMKTALTRCIGQKPSNRSNANEDQS